MCPCDKFKPIWSTSGLEPHLPQNKLNENHVEKICEILNWHVIMHPCAKLQSIWRT